VAKFQIKQGKDIKLKGEADKQIVELALPAKIAVQPQDFKGLKLRLVVKEGDIVKRGSTLLTDKTNPEIKILSPLAGKISAINRGAKRALFQVVIDVDNQQDVETFQIYRQDELSNISSDDVKKVLLSGGLWCTVRQRPYSHIADPSQKPKSIFIHAMNTEPLALDVDTILEGQEELFQAGCTILSKLTDGVINVCVKESASSKTLTNLHDVQIHQFSGPHPAGNVGTHIHYVDPINKGDLVWFVEAQDVLNIARLFTQGTYPNERVVAITGEGASKNTYAKTVIGAPLSFTQTLITPSVSFDKIVQPT